jgi:hypothetical protein
MAGYRETAQTVNIKSLHNRLKHSSGAGLVHSYRVHFFCNKTRFQAWTSKIFSTMLAQSVIG